MIRFANKAYSRETSLSSLSPVVRDWFTGKFDELTPPQRYSFRLITAPTGSGKTLCLCCHSDPI